MPPKTQPKNWPLWLGAAFILVVTFLAYFPIFHAGFIWDDDALLNPLVKSRDGLRQIWFSTVLPDFFPLTSTSFWIEWRLWGMNATGYHVTNLFLHAISSVILWRIFLKLKLPGSWLAAALFALHPVNVESVAWIAERKNTLCFFFYALSVFYYLRFAAEQNNPPIFKSRWYLLSLATFLLALLSKTSVVMLPFALLLLAFWQKNKIQKRDLLNTIPFFFTSLVLGLITIWFQYNRSIGGDPMPDKNVLMRLADGCRAIGFYLWKAIFPANLSFVYPDWNNPPSLLAWIPFAILVALLALLWRFRRSRGRPFLFAIAYFGLMLLPILGFLKIYFLRYSPVADHYQYFALQAVTAAISAALFYFFNRSYTRAAKGSRAAARHEPPVWIAGLLLIGCGILTWQQTEIYQSESSLWNATLQKNPRAWLAHNNLGLILDHEGRRDEAINHYRQSLAIQPVQIEAHNNLGSSLLDDGKISEALNEYQAAFQLNANAPVTLYNLANVYDRQGRRADARALYEKAIKINPEYLDAHNNLACLFALQGNYDEAIPHFRAVLEINPDYVNALNNLGSVLTELGRPAEAIPFLQRALKLRANYADAESNLGNALLALNHAAESIPYFQRALQINPQMPQTHYKLGNALMQSGRGAEALSHYTAAVRLQPDLAEAHYQSGVLFSADKKTEEAINQFKETLRLKPEWLEPLNNLAWIYATRNDAQWRNNNEAIRLAEKAADLTGRKSAAILDTLAAAYANAGQFKKAEETIHEAITLAEKNNEETLKTDLQKRLDAYRAQKPWREN